MLVGQVTAPFTKRRREITQPPQTTATSTSPPRRRARAHTDMQTHCSTTVKTADLLHGLQKQADRRPHVQSLEFFKQLLRRSRCWRSLPALSVHATTTSTSCSCAIRSGAGRELFVATIECSGPGPGG